MGAKELNLKLLSPEKPLAEMSVKEVSVPSDLGYVGLLPDHAAIVSMLGTGVVTVKTESDGDIHYFVSGGFIECFDNNAVVLVDTIEHSEEIDFERAHAAEERAIKRLEEKSDLDLDIGRALASLERARARKRLTQLRNS